MSISEIGTIITSVAGLAVAVGGLVVSVGVFMLVVKLGNAIEAFTRSESKDG